MTRILEVSTMEADWPVAEISSALRGMCIKIVEDNQVVCVDVLSVVIDDDGRQR